MKIQNYNEKDFVLSYFFQKFAINKQHKCRRTDKTLIKINSDKTRNDFLHSFCNGM